MNITLVTVVGSYIGQLPHMLDHYRKLGVNSFVINVHLQHRDDPILTEVERVVSEFGCAISSISVGKWSDALNEELFNRSRSASSDEWFILADLDEFQLYPRSLPSVFEECERKGYDYIQGCLVDRIAADGRLNELLYDKPIEDQFPLGSIFTYSVLGGLPLKITAAKAHVKILAGNHFARGVLGCPITECFVQVNHYKWVSGLIERMEQRSRDEEWKGLAYKSECCKFVEYYHANNGRIDITDPNLLVSKCDPGYKYLETIKQALLDFKSGLLRDRGDIFKVFKNEE
jgi:hypothetical protein